MINLGDFEVDAIIPVPFDSFGTDGESITISGFTVSNIKIYKDNGTTERSSTNGYTLDDTDGIDFDGKTGIHGFKIDTSDNSDSGFYAKGSDYRIVVDAITVNAQTVSFTAGIFSIGNREAVWDVLLRAGNHNIKNSAGYLLRRSGAKGGTTEVTIHSGTAQGPGSGNNQIQLDNAAESTNNIYNGNIVVIRGGTGVGQTRSFIAYAGSTRIGTVDKDWAVLPDSSSVFDIKASSSSVNSDEGLAQGGENDSSGPFIILQDTASNSDGIYDGFFVTIISGTGAGQNRIAAELPTYDGTTKRLYVTAEWGTPPDSTSGYVINPAGAAVSDSSGSGGPTAGEIRAEMDINSVRLLAIQLVTDLLENMIVADSGDDRFTTGALQNAPTDVNVTQISGGSFAADNLKLMYDGTGYTDDSAPASRSQVNAIGASTGGSLNIQVTEDNTAGPIIDGVTFVGSVQGATTFANTEAEDGVYHDIDDTGSDIDIVYGFDVGGGRVSTDIVFAGFVQGNGDEIKIKVFDHVGSDWEIIGTIPGSNSTVNVVLDLSLLLKHTGTGSELGKVYIRFETDSTTPSNLSVDQLLVSAVNIGQSVGYAGGQVWLNTLSGTAGTEPFVNGVGDNPTDLIASAKTIGASVGLSDFHIINGSTVLLAESSTNESYFGDNWTLQLGGQNVADAYFQGAHVTGVGVSATEVHYEGCDIETMSTQLGHFDFCGFSGTVTFTLAGDYKFHNCYSNVAGPTGPSFTKTAGQAITASWRNWMDSLTLSGLEAGDVVTINGRLGTITLNGADAVVEIRGSYKEIVNNLTGTPTVNLDGANKGSDIADTLADTNAIQPVTELLDGMIIPDSGDDRFTTGALQNAPGTDGANTTTPDAAGTAAGLHSTTDALIAGLNDFDPSVTPVEILATGGTAGKNAAELVDDMWDEDISKSEHNVSQSAAKKVRESDISITADTAQGPGTGNNQIQLATGASSVDGAYDPARVFIKDGTGAGQSRNILEYDGASRTATVDRNWKVNPTSDSEYIILADAGREHVNEGLAQAGNASPATITLNTLASADNNAYKNQYVFIRSGTGEDQVRRIISYVGATKIATISRAWAVVPDSTSGYVMIPFACVEVQAIGDTELAAKVGSNLDVFFQNAGNDTIVTVDDIGTIQAVTDLLNNMIIAASGDDRFTAGALQNAPATSISETEFHANLDSYTNKDDYKLLAVDVVTALMADTGFTVGGTMNYEKLLKILAAWVSGNWRDKSGEDDIKELLDADDAATVILEMTLSQTTPQRLITVQI